MNATDENREQDLPQEQEFDAEANGQGHENSGLQVTAEVIPKIINAVEATASLLTPPMESDK